MIPVYTEEGYAHSREMIDVFHIIMSMFIKFAIYSKIKISDANPTLRGTPPKSGLLVSTYVSMAPRVCFIGEFEVTEPKKYKLYVSDNRPISMFDPFVFSSVAKFGQVCIF